MYDINKYIDSISGYISEYGLKVNEKKGRRIQVAMKAGFNSGFKSMWIEWWMRMKYLVWLNMRQRGRESLYSWKRRMESRNLV